MKRRKRKRSKEKGNHLFISLPPHSYSRLLNSRSLKNEFVVSFAAAAG